jgi:hypothetical protein
MTTKEQKWIEKMQKDWSKKHPRTKADRIQDAWMIGGALLMNAYLIYSLGQLMIKLAQ